MTNRSIRDYINIIENAQSEPAPSQMYKAGWNDGVEDEINDQLRQDPEYVRGFRDGLNHAMGPRGRGRSNPRRYGSESGVAEGLDDDDTNDYYAGYYADLLSQIRNMSWTDIVDTKLRIKRSLESGKLKLVDLKSEIRALDREIIRTKKGMAEGSEKHECPECDGSGYVQWHGSDTECPKCDGTGYVNDEQGVAEEQLEETTPEAMTKVERLFRS